MIPTIKQLSDLLPFIEGNKQIRVKTEENGMTVVCYMVQDEDTFSGEHEHMERECRGITFNPDGTIAARTLHKFFNIGEREDTQPHVLPWHEVTRIMEKRDGSMVTPVMMTNGVIRFPWFKTKKSFETKEAALAAQVAVATPGGCEWIEQLLLDGFTPTFEITSPRFPIVIKYDKDELTLLHVRENVSGRYLTEQELQALGSPFPIVPNLIEQFSWGMADAGIPKTVEVRWDLLKQAAETTENLEGWVIQFKNGEMVKLKTKWYNELHHAVTFTRWRDVARAVCDDKTDDLKGAFVLCGRSIDPILAVERQIKQRIEQAEMIVNSIVADAQQQNFDAKTTALTYKDNPLFGLIMTKFRGKEPSWMEWYVKHHLEKDWGLEVI
jgi:RNA ligase